VHEAEKLSAARFLRQPHVYDLVMLDGRRYSSEETREFCEQIEGASPPQQFAFLTGPPKYLYRTWPGEVAGDDTSRGQWAETVKRFVAAGIRSARARGRVGWARRPMRIKSMYGSVTESIGRRKGAACEK